MFSAKFAPIFFLLVIGECAAADDDCRLLNNKNKRQIVDGSQGRVQRLEYLLRNISLEIAGMQRRRQEEEAPSQSTTVPSTTPAEGDTDEDVRRRFAQTYPVEVWKSRGWFDDDYLRLINVHWLKFPPPPKELHYLLAFVYAAVAACGFIGNALVIFMFFKCPSLRTPANILIVNLAISDFLMISEAPVFVFNAIHRGPATGRVGCKVYGFVGGVTGTVSIGTLAAIAFDRYSVVVYPLAPLRNITKLRARLSVLFVWLYGGVFAAIPALDVGLGRYVPEGFLTSCSFDYLSDDRRHRLFIFAFFLAAWALPLLVIAFCYANILRVVVETRTTLKEPGGDSTRHCKEQQKRKSELRLAGIVIGVIALFFVAWTPYAAVALLGIFGYKSLITPLTSMLPAVFCKVASCIDPFVYILTHPKFRRECENLLLSKEQRRKRSTMRLHYSHSNNNNDEATGPVALPTPERMTAPDLDDGVEVLAMGDVPYANEPDRDADATPYDLEAQTHVSGTPLGRFPTTPDESGRYRPPSWFAKPKFQHRQSSLKTVVKTIQRMRSEDALPT